MTGSDNERSSDEEMACTPVFGINGVRHLLEADKTERYRQTYSDNNAVLVCVKPVYPLLSIYFPDKVNES